MSNITLVGDKSTGHDSCPPVPAITGSRTVRVGGRAVVLVGDSYAPHACDDHSLHSDTLLTGAPHVRIEGKAVGRMGDKVSNGSKVAEGFPTVIIGNKGGERYKDEFAFESMLRKLNKETFSEQNELLLCLPKIAHAIAGQ